jgi:tRNA G18 (ribose-2'-O)-methylase SpoU
MGSESHGISAAVRAMEQARVVAIPRVGGAESLNVAMATAGLLTELTRQLRAPRL